MAVMADECRRMLRTCQTNRIKLMVAYHVEFHAGHARLAELVRSGGIGAPKTISSDFTLRVQDPEDVRLQRRLGGGTVYDLGVSVIFTARTLFAAEPAQVMAMTARMTRRYGGDVDESTVALIRFPEDRLTHFHTSFGEEPAAILTVFGDDGFARAAIGSGPYRVVEQVSGSHVKLEAVDSHWRVGVPRYKTIVFKRIPEEATRVAILRRGEADIVELSRDRVKEVERAGFRVVLKKSDAYLDLYWTPPWDNTPIKDKRVREALNLAIDRGEMAATIFGGLAEPCSIPMGFSWAYPAIKFRVPPELVYPFDPVRAKALLAEAGYPNGFPIDMYAYQLPGLAEGRSMTEAIAGYWQKIGVQPKIVPIDYAGFRKKRIDGVTPGAFGFFNLANRDWVGAYAYIEKASSASSPLPTVRDAEIDGMVERILTQTDQEKINALMRNIFLRLRSEHFGIPLVYLHTAYATSKKIGAWNPGQVLYDFNIEGLVASK